MAIEITGGLKRIVQVHGIGRVEVTMTESGVTFRVPKTRKFVITTWGQIVDHCSTLPDVPSWLMGKPRQLLMHEVEKVQKKAEKKITGA